MFTVVATVWTIIYVFSMEESLDSSFAEVMERPRSSASRPSNRAGSQNILTVVSFFAGIGGFDLAFERAGAKVKAQCELDPYCRAILQKHWPDIDVHKDIRKLEPEQLPDADIWTAGFPCQDVSLARGNHGRSGLKGHHTSLFFRLMDLVEKKQPPVLLLENVVGLLNSHRGADFAIILKELTSRGYAVAWRVLNARYFGAPQSRSRVFLCAWRGSHHRAIASLYEPVAGRTPGSERVGFLTKTVHKTGAIVPQIAYCLAATSGRHTGNDWARSYVSYKDRVRRPTPTESERLQGFPAEWTDPPKSYSVPARGADSERYKSIGNAVAVPVVTWVAKRVLVQISDSSNDRLSLSTDVRKSAPDLAREAREVRLKEILARLGDADFSYRWKPGGCAWEDTIIEGAVSPAPSKVIESKFVEMLDRNVPDDRYFLTPNAAMGIVRRADTVGRTLFQPFRDALEAMIAGCGGPKPQSGGFLAKPSIRPPRSDQRA